MNQLVLYTSHLPRRSSGLCHLLVFPMTLWEKYWIAISETPADKSHRNPENCRSKTKFILTADWPLVCKIEQVTLREWWRLQLNIKLWPLAAVVMVTCRNTRRVENKIRPLYRHYTDLNIQTLIFPVWQVELVRDQLSSYM